jgi:hypothetical protein
MSVGPTPSLNFIGDTVGDVAPHSMSEMRGINFASGNSPITGTIRLGDFRNQTLTAAFVEQAKIQASDNQDDDWFGYSVAISGDGNTAIVGAYLEDTGFGEAGAAYIFTRSGTSWSEQQKIQALDKAATDMFAYSVAISNDGNTAIVGAYLEDGNTGNVYDSAGAAYIFTRSGTTWSEQQKFEASDKQFNDEFGCSVAISGDGNTAIVGARFEDTGALNAGAAYIFTRSGTSWSEQQKIQASYKTRDDYFGTSVAISEDGNTAIVGAHEDNVDDAGAAYIFTRSGTTWTQQQKIQASDKQGNDEFGKSVAISGDGNTAIVGARLEDTGVTIGDAGAAYIFTRSGTTWTQQQKIQASDKQNYDEFGQSVAISGDGNTAIVGAYKEDSVGAAYIFTRSGTTWTQREKIQASDKQGNDQFGWSTSISSDGNTAIVGANKEDTDYTDTGAAYIYQASYYT